MAEGERQDAGGEEELIAFLSNPASHGAAEGHVEVIETHAARVFLVGDKAYKIKKPVTLPFLDFSTRDRRRAALAREFELNHPHAPEIYVALGNVNRNASGALTFATGDPVEPILVMNRFEQDLLLAHIAEEQPLSREIARGLALMTARYHRSLAPMREHSGAKIMRDIVSQIADQLETPPAQTDKILLAELAHGLREATEHVAPCLDTRSDAGYVRRCHGDLHLRNIVVLDGTPVPFDALEFDEKLATTDVLYDLAFLLMDLDVRGQENAANIVLNAYVAAEPTGGEIGGLATLPLFLATRAAVRAVVDLARARQEHGNADREHDIARATDYVRAAARYLAPPPPRLVAVGGLSGTGKSTLSAALAPSLGATPGALIQRTDVERKRLFGVPETQRLAPEHYTEDASDKVYARLYDKTLHALRAGHSVIFDGVSAKPRERDRLAAIAREAGCAFHGLWLEAPIDVQIARVGARRGDASDSDEAVVRAQAARDPGPVSWTRIAAGLTPADTRTQAEAALGLRLP